MVSLRDIARRRVMECLQNWNSFAARPNALPAVCLPRRCRRRRWTSGIRLRSSNISCSPTRPQPKGCLRTMDAGQPQRGKPDFKQRLRQSLRSGNRPLSLGVRSRPNRWYPARNWATSRFVALTTHWSPWMQRLRTPRSDSASGTRVLNHPVLGPLTAQAVAALSSGPRTPSLRADRRPR